MGRKNIILLHGWGATANRLEPLSKRLERFGWKVFIPKLPGFDVDSPSYAWGLSEYAKYVISEGQKFYKEEKFFVFGHSFGGRIATKMALGTHVSGIILCASSGFSRPNFLKRTIFYFLAKAGKKLLPFPFVARLWRRGIYKLAREHDYEKAQGIMKDVFKNVVSENLKQIVPEIKLPVLILWGALDKMTPLKDAYFIKKSLPGSKLKVYEDEGHQLPYNRPNQLAKEIDKWATSLN